ncbi:MAG: flagellar basal-body rod protein FlgF [Methylophilaceae bacterium]|uniref:flagellar basal-body rod protein FlgF n=1 Tax=Methylovorus sp. MM2 TaxID=1848038 RepID=UPI0007DEE97C|nr:flagellar basal-body rod protein FlgF [Methylovorus sp. MM2]OAM51273.1 flagellar basal-body rod protein FlgF [Methylovorus sp. MM2]
MDRVIYTGMSGAKQIFEQQATTTHNLANVSTTGFKAQVDSFRAVPIQGPGLPTRTFVVDTTVTADFKPGPIQQTNRDLDLAIEGKGWLAVRRADGSEAYTRNGSLKISENGLLQTENGLSVLSESGGPISIPPDVRIAIGKDGTISSMQSLTAPGPTNIVDRLKLVNPSESNLVRGGDGLFETADKSNVLPDATVRVVNGALEGSNVNVIDAMVNMIDLARQFDTHMKLLQNAENNDSKATQILSLS